MANGFTREEAERSIHALSEWLSENYPVAGAVVASWIRGHAPRGN